MDDLNVPWERSVKQSSTKFKPNAVLDEESISTEPEEWTDTIAVWIVDVFKVFFGSYDSSEAPNCYSCFE